MCGIGGVLGGTRDELAAMLAALRHRGPDGEGFWFDDQERAGLAHTRLSIIDVTDAAAQPMDGVEGRYSVVFNGEIYNFRELAADLRGRGHVFNPNSDTAVLAPLFHTFGPGMLDRLNGIFAFAIWDRQERSLFVARDGYGVKPLYYARRGSGLAFASELKALIGLEGIDRDVDRAALASYLVRLWSPGEATLVNGVRKLEPGCWLKAAGGRIRIERWRRPPRYDPRPISRREAADRALDVMDRAVSDQCLSDVPVGAFLSGGVDSSAVVSSMTRAGTRPKMTYCIGYADREAARREGMGDDFAHAELAAAALGVAHARIEMQTPTGAELEGLAWMLDEPQADIAPLFVARIAQAARADGIKVLLSGAGGDDVFTGYRRHQVACVRPWLRPASGVLRAVASATAAARSPGFRRAAKLAELLAGDDDAFVSRCFDFNDPDAARELVRPGPPPTATDDGAWRAEIESTRGLPLVERVLHQETVGFLPDHNLNYTDKAGMAHGVEIRVPFLDPRVADFAAGLPAAIKGGALAPKRVLKDAYSSRLPRSVLHRRKTGFGAPVREWLKGPLAEPVGDVLNSARLRSRGLLDADAVSELFEDHRAGRRDAGYLILAVYMIETWLTEAERHRAVRIPAPARV